MKIWKFRIASFAVVALMLAGIYVVVGANEELPFVLSDNVMLNLVGRGGLQFYKCDYENGCDPTPTGTCISRKKYYDWSGKYYCDWTGSASSFCNQYDYDNTCYVYVYDDDDCQAFNYSYFNYYYTACNSDP